MNSDTPSLDQSFWNSHWESGNTGWDIGYASPPITEYMDQYLNKEAAILIPGSGNAYEAAYLADHGFTDITLVDIAPKAVALQKEKFADTPQVTPVHSDFFAHQASYDLIIEQTFFCAIPPDRREEYASKAASLLNDEGKIIGVLFSREIEREGPPFGGTAEEYASIFEPRFTLNTMEACYNSIPPRAGAELFIELLKKHEFQPSAFK